MSEEVLSHKLAAASARRCWLAAQAPADIAALLAELEAARAQAAALRQALLEAV